MGDFNVFHIMPWSGAYSIYFFLIGISACMFFFSALSWYRPEFKEIRLASDNISFGLLAVSGVLLIGDLTQPMRFLNMINPMYLQFSSPLAWGSLDLISFGVVSVLYFYSIHKSNSDEASEPQAGDARCIAGAGLADLHRLRPDRAPEPSGMEYTFDAGIVRGAFLPFRRGPGGLYRQG